MFLDKFVQELPLGTNAFVKGIWTRDLSWSCITFAQKGFTASKVSFCHPRDQKKHRHLDNNGTCEGKLLLATLSGIVQVVQREDNARPLEAIIVVLVPVEQGQGRGLPFVNMQDVWLRP